MAKNRLTTTINENAWGILVDDIRQEHLVNQLRIWQAIDEHERPAGPFVGQRLSGADVFFLTAFELVGTRLDCPDLASALALLLQVSKQNKFREYLYLPTVHLEGASLGGAHLEGASLGGAHLEGAYMYGAHLERTDFRGTWFDSRTILRAASLDSQTMLGDIHWNGVGGVDLTLIDWEPVRILGDEANLGWRASTSEHEAIVRAYRQLSIQLRSQGVGEVADRFTYRGQVRYRNVLLRRLRLPQFFGSWLLSLISGYGFKPGRSFIAYVLVIVAFAAAFLSLGTGAFGIGGHDAINSPLSALVFSVTSFHGRGFFPGEGLKLDDPITVLAAVEAILGLFIEITFIATFTQRFFAR